MAGVDAGASAPSTPSPFAPAVLVAVLVGGALGTATRVGLGLLFGSTMSTVVDVGSSEPLPTEVIAPPEFWGLPPADVADSALIAALVANLLGSLALGVIAGAHWPPRLEWLRAGLGAGFCGAFTTFSLVMLALAARDFASPWAWALLVVGLVGGLLLAAVGAHVGRGLRPAPAADPTSERDS